MTLLPLYDPPAGLSDFDAIPGQRLAWRRFLVLQFHARIESLALTFGPTGSTIPTIRRRPSPRTPTPRNPTPVECCERHADRDAITGRIKRVSCASAPSRVLAFDGGGGWMDPRSTFPATSARCFGASGGRARSSRRKGSGRSPAIATSQDRIGRRHKTAHPATTHTINGTRQALRTVIALQSRPETTKATAAKPAAAPTAARRKASAKTKTK
jgi:hypothetical protein